MKPSTKYIVYNSREENCASLGKHGCHVQRIGELKFALFSVRNEFYDSTTTVTIALLMLAYIVQKFISSLNMTPQRSLLSCIA
jgi:hypothetical protein